VRHAPPLVPTAAWKGVLQSGRHLPLRTPAFSVSLGAIAMIATETINQIENIKKRAGHLWRFL
jgi:hypothetical protein